MKKLVSIFLILFFVSAVKSQILYVDPITSVALGIHGNQIKKGQEEQNKKLTKLEKAQAFVATQLVAVNKIQDKVYKGLSEVSGTISNGIQVKNIYEDLRQCKKYLEEIGKLVNRHPQYSVFGAKASEKAYERILEIGTDVREIVADGDTNLATAGDRYRLLFNIQDNVKMLRIYLLSIKLNIEYAERVGFWKAINPFQGYINTDKSIIQNIMHKYKNNF